MWTMKGCDVNMKYALIGCGRIATNHMTAAVNNKLRIVAVCDVMEKKTEDLLVKHELSDNPDIKRYVDYKLMIEKEKPELRKRKLIRSRV